MNHSHTAARAVSVNEWMSEWGNECKSECVSAWIYQRFNFHWRCFFFTGDDFDFCPSAPTWEGSLLLGAKRWEWENALLKWPHQSNNRHRHRHSHGHFLWLLTRTRLWILFSFSFYSSSAFSLVSSFAFLICIVWRAELLHCSCHQLWRNYCRGEPQTGLN